MVQKILAIVTIGVFVAVSVFLLFSFYFAPEEFSPSEQMLDAEEVFEALKTSFANDSSYLDDSGALHFGYRTKGVGFADAVPCFTHLMGYYHDEDCIAPLELYFLESNPDGGILFSDRPDILSIRARDRVDAVVAFGSAQHASDALQELYAFWEHELFLDIERARYDEPGVSLVREYDRSVPDRWPHSRTGFAGPGRYNVTVRDILIVYSAVAFEE